MQIPEHLLFKLKTSDTILIVVPQAKIIQSINTEIFRTAAKFLLELETRLWQEALEKGADPGAKFKQTLYGRED